MALARAVREALVLRYLDCEAPLRHPVALAAPDQQTMVAVAQVDRLTATAALAVRVMRQPAALGRDGDVTLHQMLMRLGVAEVDFSQEARELQLLAAAVVVLALRHPMHQQPPSAVRAALA